MKLETNKTIIKYRSIKFIKTLRNFCLVIADFGVTIIETSSETLEVFNSGCADPHHCMFYMFLLFNTPDSHHQHISRELHELK